MKPSFDIQKREQSMNVMRRMVGIGATFCVWVHVALAADVVSNAMTGARYSGLAPAVAAAANGDRLVMIGDDTLASTLVISSRVLSIVSDGAVRTVWGSTNCSYDMVEVAGTNAMLTLGQPSGSDAAPTLIFDGKKNAGVTNLFDMFFLGGGCLTLHPGVVLRNLGSVDVGAINNSGGVVEMRGGRIENNSAAYGGGIYNKMGEVRISGGSITGNLSNVGGGIYNEAVELFQWAIVAYVGRLELSGGTVAGNVANQLGGGIFNLGALELSGGRVERNAAEAGGGVYHNNGAEYGMVLRGEGIVAGNTAAQGSGVYYNNDSYTWLLMAEGGRVEPPNDVFMASNASPIILSGPLSGRGIAAQLTPTTYSTNQFVLGAMGTSNLWLVSNYYGKFSVTPEEGGGTWYVGAEGSLSRVDPASLPTTIGELEITGEGLEMGIDPAYVAWDGVLDYATNIVNHAWNFQPLLTNAYSVTNGRVVVARDAPLRIFKMRRE